MTSAAVEKEVVDMEEVRGSKTCTTVSFIFARFPMNAVTIKNLPLKVANLTKITTKNCKFCKNPLFSLYSFLQDAGVWNCKKKNFRTFFSTILTLLMKNLNPGMTMSITIADIRLNVTLCFPNFSI